MMQDYEKLGVFYLGREEGGGKDERNLLLYDSSDLTTHAMMVGMTGSGKTGLATGLIEEAAIDGIPSILIDPKGDLVNLLLQFPELRTEDFRPWVDESDAQRKGMTPDELASKTAQTWRKGLAGWDQDGERIRRLQDAAEVTVYTPGSTAVRPLQVLRSFAAPPPEVVRDSTAMRERVMSAVSGLLSLLGISADPIQSRDHILLSTILNQAWSEGRDLDLAGIIMEVQKPSFHKVGVFDLESFYPAKDRFGLAMSLNNIIASPGFAAWMSGEPLDIRRLLRTRAGKPRVSILYLAHLSDSERMFFVTLLLNEVLTWMRTQSGTGSLRAILYMDEIFGYFPPGAMPPSKTPMLTLLKQARAFGLGVVLATQNPVDLDYKGLSNCGTWFIGRLQTERDKMRVLDGLEGAAAGTGAGFDRSSTEKLISALGNRRFLMRNVHDPAPTLFETRWVLSYLRGPMTLAQLAHFKPEAPATGDPGLVDSPAAERSAAPGDEAVAPERQVPQVAQSASPEAVAPLLPPANIDVFYLRPDNPTGRIFYRASVVAVTKLHFADARAKLDTWVDRNLLAGFAPDGLDLVWDEMRNLSEEHRQLDRDPLSGADFRALPAIASNARSYDQWKKQLASTLYQTATLRLLTSPETKLTSRHDEEEGDFRGRVADAMREERDRKVAQLKARYGSRLQTLSDRLRKAQDRVESHKTRSGQQQLNTAVSLGATLLGAFLGRGTSVGTVGRAATTMKSAGRIGKSKADTAAALEEVAVLERRLADLQKEFDDEVEALQVNISPEKLEIEERHIRPRKTDITISALGICWTPWREAHDGTVEPA